MPQKRHKSPSRPKKGEKQKKVEKHKKVVKLKKVEKPKTEEKQKVEGEKIEEKKKVGKPKKRSKLKKAERKKKLQEKKRVIKLEHLSREINYGNVTRRKHERNWRDFVMKIGREMIADEVEYMWQIFEWSIDVKDCTISVLMDELHEAKEQNLFIQQNHFLSVANWMHRMHENLEDLRNKFSISLENLKNDNNKTNSEYMKNTMEMHIQMKMKLNRTEAEHIEIWRAEVIRHFHLMQFIKEAEAERRHCESIYKEKLRNMVDQYEVFYKQHMTDIEKINQLKISISACDTTPGLKKIAHYVDVIRILKEKQEKHRVLEEKGNHRLGNLKENRNEFYGYLFTLKKKFFNDNTVDSNRVKVLVCSVELILEHFKSICKKGELLVRAACVNRRYETFSEKILPYPALDYLRMVPSEHNLNVAGKMFLFYQKMAAVDAERTALSEERKLLLLEQSSLKKKFENLCANMQFSKYKQVKRLKPIENFKKTFLRQY